MKKTLFFVALTLALAAWPASAQPQYDPGASDTEIKIGNVAPYRAPVSLYGAVGKVEAAFFRMMDDQRRHQRTQDQFHQLPRCL